MWLCHPARAHRQVMRGCGRGKAAGRLDLTIPEFIILGFEVLVQCNGSSGYHWGWSGRNLDSADEPTWGWAAQCQWTALGLWQLQNWFFASNTSSIVNLTFFFFWQNWYAHVKHLGSDKEWLNKLLRLMGKELYVKNAVVTLLSIKYSLISLYYKFIFCRYIWEGVWHSQGLCSFSQQITVKTCHVMSQMEFSPSRQAVLCELHLK